MGVLAFAQDLSKCKDTAKSFMLKGESMKPQSAQRKTLCSQKEFPLKDITTEYDYVIKESGNGRVKDGNKTTDNLRDHRREEK